MSSRFFNFAALVNVKLGLHFQINLSLIMRSDRNDKCDSLNGYFRYSMHGKIASDEENAHLNCLDSLLLDCWVHREV